jgi:sulfite exporter TauE/SafE
MSPLLLSVDAWTALAPALGGAALAGVAGSPHCVGMCGGFAVATGTTAGGSIAWSLGRLSTYAILGAIAGTFGALVPGPGWVGTALAAGMLVWFAARLAGVGAVASPSFPWFTRMAGKLLRHNRHIGRFAFGAVNGLLPCGLVYAALAFPVAVGNPVGGALTMLAFGLGTVPALAVAVVGLRKLTAASLTARRAVALVVLVTGLGSLAIRADTLSPGAWRTTTDAECH